jgi:hypothetical protein
LMGRKNEILLDLRGESIGRRCLTDEPRQR